MKKLIIAVAFAAALFFAPSAAAGQADRQMAHIKFLVKPPEGMSLRSYGAGYYKNLVSEANKMNKSLRDLRRAARAVAKQMEQE